MTPLLAEKAEKNPFDFAESLFQQQDYYRAMVEYQRASYGLGGPMAARAQLRVAESLYLAGQHQQLLTQTATIETNVERMRWLRALSFAALNRPAEALKTQNSKDAALNLQFMLWRWQNQLLEQNLQKPRFQTYRPQKLAGPIMAGEIAQTDLQLLENQWPSSHNPWLAGLLSAAVPGAGQAYTGNWGDALSNLAVVGGLAGLSALAFSNDEQGLGIIGAALAGVFYGGNIYGAYRSAAKKNRQAVKSYLVLLKKVSFRYQVARF